MSPTAARRGSLPPRRRVADPYTVAHGRHRLRTSCSASSFASILPTSPASSCTAYADRDDGADDHPSRPAYRLSPASGLRSNGFTGLNFVYEPVRDGELRYWCELKDANHENGPFLGGRPQRPSSCSASLAGFSARRSHHPDLRRRHHARRRPRPHHRQAGGDPLAPFATSPEPRPTTASATSNVPIATGGQAHASKIATFRAEPQTLSVLRGRFDAVSLANNHSGDYGHAAFLETMQHLDDDRHRVFRRRPQPWPKRTRAAVDREAWA